LTSKNLLLFGFFCLLMAPLFFYYWLKVIVPNYVVMMLFLVWIISLVLDMGITVCNQDLIINHESNVIFRRLYEKYHIIMAIIVQITIEVSFVLLMPFLFERTSYMIDVQASSIISGIISVLHFIAYCSNNKVIKTIQNHHM
jgi:hypothetical protein